MKAQTTLCAHSFNPHEGRNTPLRLSGQLEGYHRLDLLLLPFLLSRGEKEVGVWGEAPAKLLKSLLRLPNAPHEGQNDLLRIFSSIR